MRGECGGEKRDIGKGGRGLVEGGGPDEVGLLELEGMVVAGVGVVLDVDMGRGEYRGGDVFCEAFLCCAYMSMNYEVRFCMPCGFRPTSFHAT
jgi:hypothetical protein